MKLRRTLAILLFLLFTTHINSFAQEKEKINWLSISEATDLYKMERKPILIDLFTDWCYWCKVMDSRTYQNKDVIAYINSHFYPVKLNAETKDSIMWNRKLYVYGNQYNLNTFSLYATRGVLKFPTTIFFADLDNPIPVQGYLRTGDIEPILKYYGEGSYKEMNYKQFSGKYKNVW